MVESGFPSKTTDAGHERSDLSANKIALFGISLAGLIVVVLFATYLLIHRFYTQELRKQTTPSPLSYAPELTPGPRLMVNPGQELKEMRAAEDRILNTYDWMDSEKGIVRIPIDRAVEILAQKGLPARQQPRAEATPGSKRHPQSGGAEGNRQ